MFIYDRDGVKEVRFNLLPETTTKPDTIYEKLKPSMVFKILDIRQ